MRWGLGVGWTSLSISLLPLHKRTPRAHTGHRDKIQQELPSADHCWAYFPHNYLRKGHPGIFKTSLLKTILDPPAPMEYMSQSIQNGSKWIQIVNFKSAGMIWDDELFKQMFRTTCSEDNVTVKDSPKRFHSRDRCIFTNTPKIVLFGFKSIEIKPINTGPKKSSLFILYNSANYNFKIDGWFPNKIWIFEPVNFL